MSTMERADESLSLRAVQARRRDRVRRLARLARQVPRHLILIAFGILFGFPMLWMLSSSLKPSQALFQYPPQILPWPITFDNYTQLFQYFPVGRFFLNSLIITTLNVTGTLVSCSMAAYSFSRLHWPGRNMVFALTLATIFLPTQVTLVPLYLIFRSFGWVDTWYPLWVPAWFGVAFYIFLLRQFFLSLPTEIEDAAKVDGAGYLRIFLSIELPLMRPALITVALFSFMSTWNDFVTPLIYIHSTDKMPLALGLQFINSTGAYVGQSFWGMLMAGAVCATLPMVILFLFLQRYFVRGIVMTGLKG
ncbi:MAG TPA: carbohydrate ABC transporter permease [Chloroflexota bacterium]|nr:carbohydrate ABC transporter permease [Chloroflexota bacterium]